VNQGNLGVRVAGQEAEQVVLALDRVRLVPRVPAQVQQIPAKAASGRLSSSANQVGVLRGFV
jgi:hypothetical protein